MIDTLNRHVIQPLVALRSGSKHLRYLRLLKQTQYDPPDVIRAHQWIAVQKLLKHAYYTVPFYRERFGQLGLHPNDFKRLEDVQRLPVLTKSDLRKHASRLRSDLYTDDELMVKRTSGSTGVAIEVVIDRSSVEWKTACTIRSDEWSGWRLGGRIARLWGNPDYLQEGWRVRLRKRLVERTTYLDTLGVDESRLRGFAERLRARRPSLLFGHAHSLYLLACYVKKHVPNPCQPDGIISTAMLLHDYQRAAIEETFGCPVTNRYGCEEVSLIACECDLHSGLHLNSDSLYTEVLREEQLGHAPDTGSLLVTDLTNFAMPIIRYKVGDVVVKTDRSCPCGRGLPLIEKIEGREADYVLAPGGKLVSGISLTDNFATQIRGAAQVQIVQESIDLLRIRMVPGDDFDDTSRVQLTDMVRNMFGGSMRHEVELVEQIPQEPSGKYRFCISPVANEYLRAFAA
jgi:phenylacetate-coenzyme A ligase PaaK-like adenylate-forming protein